MNQDADKRRLRQCVKTFDNVKGEPAPVGVTVRMVSGFKLELHFVNESMGTWPWQEARDGCWHSLGPDLQYLPGDHLTPKSVEEGEYRDRSSC